jgi:hypothetical protein
LISIVPVLNGNGDVFRLVIVFTALLAARAMSENGRYGRRRQKYGKGALQAGPPDLENRHSADNTHPPTKATTQQATNATKHYKQQHIQDKEYE